MERARLETVRVPRVLARFAVFEAFGYRTYRRVWTATFVSQLGDWMQIFGRGVLALALTGKASAVGVVYFATYLPQLALSMWSGVVADRFDRRHVLMVSLAGQAAGAVAIAVLLATDRATLLNVSAVSFGQGLFFTLMIPAAQALMPGLVPGRALHSAISLGTTTSSITRVVGPLVGAVLVTTVGLEWIFWGNAITFVGIIAVWAVTSVPRQPPMGDRRNLDALREGIRFVRITPRVWVPIVVATFLAAVGVVYQPLSIAYATDVLAHGDLGLGASYNGWYQAAIGLGAAVGIVGLAGVGRRRPGSTLILTAGAFSILLAALGLVTHVGVALIVAFALGAMHFANMTLAINLVQHGTPEVLRGRVMSIQMLGLIGFVPIASLAGGALADVVGVGAVFTGAGLVCLAFSALAARWRRHLPRVVAPEADATLAAVGALEEEG